MSTAPPAFAAPEQLLGEQQFLNATGWRLEIIAGQQPLDGVGGQEGPGQLGGAAAAIGGGWARVHFGDYQNAFLIGGCLGLVAACLALTVDRRGIARPELPVAPGLVGA